MNSFCSVKDTVKRMRKQATDGEIFAKDTFDEGLLPKLYKGHSKFNNKKMIDPI